MTDDTISGAPHDVVVVGGGAVGMAVTDALLRRGVVVTSVYPQNDLERPAASRAAGAMLGAFGEITTDDDAAGDPAFGFRLAAQRVYPSWLLEVTERARRSVFQGSGTYVIANNVGPTDRANLRLMKRLADEVGEPAEYVDPLDVPGLNPSQHQAPGSCLFLEREHSVDPDQLLAALEASSTTFATWRHVEDQVTRIRRIGSGWRVTTTGGLVVDAGFVVLCAGSRSWEVLDIGDRLDAGLPDLYFGKGVSCLVRGGAPVPSTIRTPNRAFACGIHVVPRPDGLLYLGATNHLGTDHDSARGIEPGELHHLFDEVIHQIGTNLRETRIEELRVGYRPIVAHGQPVIGATNLPGLLVGTGTYRDGVLMSPLIGSLIADEILGTARIENPFPATARPTEIDADVLVDIGVRDIVSFLQEPRGELPYDRAEQLRRYVAALFRMAMDDHGRYEGLRDEINQQLRDRPLNETMHQIFRQIVDRPPGEAEDGGWLFEGRKGRND